jgi:DNA-binding NtrC family response regulator
MVLAEATTLKHAWDEDLPGADRRALQIEVVYSPDALRTGEVRQLQPGESLTVGREVQRGLGVADARMSRAHVRIVWDSSISGYRYADLESANGTFVNGVSSAAGVLCDGDVLRAGDTLLVCYYERAAERLTEVAKRVAGSKLPVLILGETGSGKELLARAIHEFAGCAGAFVPMNCAALPRELAASELFGHTRGAFSGADAGRLGLFRAAAGGTLFLDEIGDMPKDLQPALLRALETQSVRPVGSDLELPVKLRIIAATHADLEQAVRVGAFREDLFARLAQAVLRVPPLRQRRSEILGLAQRFVPGLRFSPSAAEALLVASWPRNIRELRSLAESLAVLNPEGVVRASELRDRIPEAVQRILERGVVEKSEGSVAVRRERLVALLAKHQGNLAAVARELGKPRSHVYRWLKLLGLSKQRFSAS